MHTDARHRDVGGREAEQPAALVAHHHLAANLVQPPEHARRPGDVAAGEGPADRRRAERLGHAIEPLDQLDRTHREVVGSAELLEQVDVAASMGAEVEVLADDDGADLEAAHEHALDERLGRLMGLLLVEGQHDRGVDARGGEQLEALLADR